MVVRVMYVIELLEAEEGGIELVDPSWCKIFYIWANFSSSGRR
jgi:hypothetical protein